MTDIASQIAGLVRSIVDVLPLWTHPMRPSRCIPQRSSTVIVAVKGMKHRTWCSMSLPQYMVKPNLEWDDEGINVECNPRPSGDEDVFDAIKARLEKHDSSTVRVFSFLPVWERRVAETREDKMNVNVTVLRFSEDEVTRLLAHESACSNLLLVVIPDDADIPDLARVEKIPLDLVDARRPPYMVLSWDQLKQPGPVFVDQEESTKFATTIPRSSFKPSGVESFAPPRPRPTEIAFEKRALVDFFKDYVRERSIADGVLVVPMFDPRASFRHEKHREAAKDFISLMEGSDRVFQGALLFGDDDECGFVRGAPDGSKRWEMLRDASDWALQRSEQMPDTSVITVVGVCVGGANRSSLVAGYIKARHEGRSLNADDPLLAGTSNDLYRHVLVHEEPGALLSHVDDTYARRVVSRKRWRTNVRDEDE